MEGKGVAVVLVTLMLFGNGNGMATGAAQQQEYSSDVMKLGDIDHDCFVHCKDDCPWYLRYDVCYVGCLNECAHQVPLSVETFCKLGCLSSKCTITSSQVDKAAVEACSQGCTDICNSSQSHLKLGHKAVV